MKKISSSPEASSDFEPLEMTRSCAADLTAQINSSCENLAGMVQRAHDQKAWQALGYPDWKSYVRAELNFSEQRSFQLLDFAVIRQELADSTIVESELLPTSEAVTRELKKVDPSRRPEVYAKAVQDAGGTKPTARRMSRTIEAEIFFEKESRETPNARLISIQSALSRIFDTIPRDLWPDTAKFIEAEISRRCRR